MVGVAHIQSKNVRSLLDQLPQYIYALRDGSQRADDFGLTHDNHISRRLPRTGANDQDEIARGTGLLQRIKMRHAFLDVPRCAVSVLPIAACFASLWPNRDVPGPLWRFWPQSSSRRDHSRCLLPPEIRQS